MQLLSEDQRMKVTDALIRARDTGRDEAEYLNGYGLLATQQWAAHVRADALKDVIMRLENASPAEFIGAKYFGGNWTANDIVAGILDRLKEIEELARKGEWLT